MAKGPDPRTHARPLADVPALLREGASRFNDARFWDAHEAWEEAWHALRAAGREADAGYVRGLILAAAALENATRRKEDGFKRQMAEGLHALLAHEAAAASLGVGDARAFGRDLARLYADACRRRDWTWWLDGDWRAPHLEVVA